jgi:hypothetical protein
VTDAQVGLHDNTGAGRSAPSCISRATTSAVVVKPIRTTDSIRVVLPWGADALSTVVDDSAIWAACTVGRASAIAALVVAAGCPRGAALRAAWLVTALARIRRTSKS